MAKCINCGEYTKFKCGYCFSCYKKNEKSKVIVYINRQISYNNMILSIDLMGISLKINYNIRIFKILMNVNKKIKT